MRSNYKKLGNYIIQTYKKNDSGEVQNLLGVSNNKYFIESIANTIGTDMRKYKVLDKNHFAFGPVTSRNGDKISIALLKEEEAIVSTSYITFKVIDTSGLLPEYLMLWFERSEFDRYARFTSHGSVREIFNWENMCEVFLPVPSIEKQKSIVKLIKKIEKFSETNEKINTIIDETIQLIFKEWFIEFKHTSVKNSKINFKNSKLGQIPEDWNVDSIGNLARVSLGGTPSRANSNYWNGDINWINSGKVNDFRVCQPSERITSLGLKKSSTKLLPKKTTILAITGATLGQTSLLEIESCANQSVIGLLENEDFPYTFLFPMIKNEISKIILGQTGGAQQHINKDDVLTHEIIVPDKELLKKHHKVVRKLYEIIEKNMFTNIKLNEFRELLIPKLMIES